MNNSQHAQLHILVVAKDPLIQHGAMLLLRAQPGWLVQSPLKPPDVSRLQNCAVKPDIALVAVADLDHDEAHCIRQLKKAHIRVVVYGSVHMPSSVRSAIAAGADTFVESGTNAESIISAIAACATGRHLVITSNATQQLLWEVNRAQGAPLLSHPHLTNREQDLLHYIAQGLSNSEIADCLHIKAGTVNAHVTRMLRKFGLTKRSQLMLLARTKNQGASHSS